MAALARQRHEAFARRRVAVLDEPAAASYRLCGYKGGLASAYSSASRLLRSAKVAERIAELQAAAARRHERRIDTIVDQLDQARLLAFEKGQAAAAVAASMATAKVLGLIIDRRVTQVKGEFDDCKS